MGLSGHFSMVTSDERLSVLQIQAAGASSEMLLRGAKRISRNIRSTDTILLWGRMCVVALPGATISGTQALVQRISELLVDIEYEIQIVYGVTALMLLRRLQDEDAVVVLNREDALETPDPPGANEQVARSTVLLPYLAFLSHYPSQHTLHLFPYELACQYQCAPLGFEQGVLTVATSQLLDTSIIAHLQAVTRRSIYLVRCDAGVISDILNYWRQVWYAKEKGVYS